MERARKAPQLAHNRRSSGATGRPARHHKAELEVSEHPNGRLIAVTGPGAAGRGWVGRDLGAVTERYLFSNAYSVMRTNGLLAYVDNASRHPWGQSNASEESGKFRPRRSPPRGRACRRGGRRSPGHRGSTGDSASGTFIDFLKIFRLTTRRILKSANPLSAMAAFLNRKPLAREAAPAPLVAARRASGRRRPGAAGRHIGTPAS